MKMFCAGRGPCALVAPCCFARAQKKKKKKVAQEENKLRDEDERAEALRRQIERYRLHAKEK